MPRAASSPLARVRNMCLSLPETTERDSHGAPSFFIRDKVCFVNYMDHHHDDGRLTLWCACPPGMREGLMKAQPDQYFVPPYVGFRGWIGVRLDREPDWDGVERVIRDAYLAVAPKTLVWASWIADRFVSFGHAGVAKSENAADLRSALAQAL